jgi:hypothetical protein
LIVLDGINFPFPELKQVILSTNNLAELHLSKIPKTGYFSVDALVTALSTSAQLRWLEIGFHYPASLPRVPTQKSTSLTHYFPLPLVSRISRCKRIFGGVRVASRLPFSQIYHHSDRLRRSASILDLTVLTLALAPPKHVLALVTSRPCNAACALCDYSTIVRVRVTQSSRVRPTPQVDTETHHILPICAGASGKTGRDKIR